MSVSVSELQNELPAFEDIQPGKSLSINGSKMTVSYKETRSPAPGENLHRLTLTSEGADQILEWNPAHSVETVWICPTGSDPMVDGTQVASIGVFD